MTGGAESFQNSQCASPDQVVGMPAIRLLQKQVTIRSHLRRFFGMLSERQEMFTQMTAGEQRADLQEIKHLPKLAQLANLQWNAAGVELQFSKACVEQTNRREPGRSEANNSHKLCSRVDLTTRVEFIELAGGRLTIMGLHTLFQRGINPGRTILPTQQ
jgi:hypothetical protein